MLGRDLLLLLEGASKVTFDTPSPHTFKINRTLIYYLILITNPFHVAPLLPQTTASPFTIRGTF